MLSAPMNDDRSCFIGGFSRVQTNSSIQKLFPYEDLEKVFMI